MMIAVIKNAMPIHITYSEVASSHQQANAPIATIVSAQEIWRGVI